MGQQQHRRELVGSVCAVAASLFAVVAAVALDVFTTRPDLPAAILFPAETSRDDAFN